MDASLDLRIVELEKRCHRLRIAVVGLVALAAGACLSGALAPGSGTLRAERFELVNAKGETRGLLELHGATPRLLLVSPENESFVALCAGPSILESRPGTAWFTETDSGFEIDEQAEPLTHGLATLTLGAPDARTELVVDAHRSVLSMEADGPMATLLVGSDGEQGLFADLALLAERSTGAGDFGHASLTATESGGKLQIGANDVEGLDLHYADGSPSLRLQDASEQAVFRAP